MRDVSDTRGEMPLKEEDYRGISRAILLVGLWVLLVTAVLAL
jgi:hypothetical protein